MAKYLVIVESPAKAKTIERYLGSDYKVEASYGHVRDLPVKELGIEIENGWKPDYGVMKDSTKTITMLRKLSTKAEKVFLATDPDREGEAIAWHLKEALKIDDEKAFRVVFNEITKSAIKNAFVSPGKVDMERVNAQQARRFLDRVVGYKISPLLWKKIRKGLSAGRVQSVAVRLVVDREREIQAFVSEEYWKLGAMVWPQSDPGAADPQKSVRAELSKHLNAGKGLYERIRPANREAIDRILADLEGKAFSVSQVTRKQTQQHAPPPFITSSLQQQASIQLRMSTRKTMQVAQGLYEGVALGAEGSTGLITYMRTDSVSVAKEALESVRKYIAEHFDPKFLPGKPNFYKSRSGAQEAHEAIRPTDVTRTPESIKSHLSGEQFKLYELIWRRFVASQMAPALLDNTDVAIAAGDYQFTLKGRTLVFAGFTEVAGRTPSKEELQELPYLEEGMALALRKLDPSQHFTEPPPRYNEASLVRALEQKGIGRPSTYASIITTIQAREYVEQKQRRFFATELGCVVTDKLVKHFPKVLDVEFTSHMEGELDQIEQGKRDYVRVLDEFYVPFKEQLDAAGGEMQAEKGTETGEVCPDCGKPLVTRWSKRGKFLGCSGYPKCKYAKPLEGAENQASVKPDPQGRTCDKCSKPMVIRTGKNGDFLGCSDYPNCKNAKTLDAQGDVVVIPEELAKCPKCGAAMVVRRSRRGLFLGCGAYPKCKTIVSLPGQPGVSTPVETEHKCEKCGKMMFLRSGKRGRFLACSGFPKCRNIKAVPVEGSCPDCGSPLVEGMRQGETVHRCSSKGCKYAKVIEGAAPAGGEAAAKGEDDVPVGENE